jgi:murein DD-endopeptidase MepM/ murein hydrolase activator NlpD
MAGLAAGGIVIAPVIAQEFPGREVDPWDIPSPSAVLSTSTQDPTVTTLVSEKVRDKIVDYEVKGGDTVSTIAEKFGISEDTIRSQNNISGDTIKVGKSLEILPVSGVLHSVKKGDSVYSIAKKYDTSPQGMVDFPYNTFANDETFELAVGQVIVVPDGVMPKVQAATPRLRRVTPDAGTVVASGSFVWPAGGKITQNFVWYHKGIDIANRAAPAIVAADAGTVVYAGCLSWGYGCHVVINHGNGYKTLYGHLSRYYVTTGQTVGRGTAIGKMGSTGRSTGTHLHFEVIRNGVYLNPLAVLR